MGTGVLSRPARLARRRAGGAGVDPDQDQKAKILDRLYEIIVERRDHRPSGSYVVSLLEGGWESIASKVREEAEEIVLAARDESDEALAHEVADLLFHVWVMMAWRDLAPAEVYEELGRRFGTSGLEEKASRQKPDENSSAEEGSE